MKLTAKERKALSALRTLDALQRDSLLATIERAAVAQRVVMKAGRAAGALTRVRATPDHKIIRAFGVVPRSRTPAPD